MRKDVFNLTDGRCYYCGCPIDEADFHVDHFIPKSKGGKGGMNLVPSCSECNLSKGNLSLDEFREKISGMLNKTHTGRMIQKYYLVATKNVKFYFEVMKNGDL